MKLFNKIKRLFFDYEEFGPETGYTITQIPKRDGDYFFSVKSPKNNYYLLHRFSSRRDTKNFEKYNTSSKFIADSIMENFKYYNEKPLYKFYRVKDKYCVLYVYYGEQDDVWLTSATRLGLALLLLSTFLTGSAILLVLYWVIKVLIVTLFSLV